MLQKSQIFFRCSAVLAFLLFGCVPSSKSNDFQSLVFPNTCESACWMGIEPKRTTADEAINILETVHGVENVTSENSGEGSWIITWNANNPNWENHGIVFVSKNTVDFVFVVFSENGMAVKDIIAEIGDPDSVGLTISGPIVKCAGASLLYPSKGLEIHLSEVEESVGVSENQVVNAFDIHPPWSSGDFPRTDTEIVPWDGYHEYCPEKWSWEE